MKNYSLHPQLLVRTPLLPIDGVVQHVLNAKDMSAQILALQSAYEMPAVQEALFLASPVLYNQMKKWLAGETMEAQDKASLELSLLRYLSRMSSRCTPFGLFAGCTLGQWGPQQAVVLDDIDAYRRHTRPDMDYLGNLAQELVKNPAIRPYLKFFPNNSIYKRGDKYRYVDYYYQQNRRMHQIVSVDGNEYIASVLVEAQQGHTISALATSLETVDIPYDDAQGFVEEMINSQLLVSELDGNTTGEEMFERLYGIINRIANQNKDAAACLNTLTGLRKALFDIDQKAPGINPGTYEFIAQSLSPLNTSYELNRLFQTDMNKDAHQCTLDQRIAGSIRKALDVINRLHTKAPETDLDRFRQAFEARYETKEVPLLEVLDIETGIGYLQSGEAKGDMNPLVDDLALAGSPSGHITLNWNTRQNFLLRKLIESVRHQKHEVVLKEEDVEEFASNWDDLPDSLQIMGNMLDNGIDQNTLPNIVIEGASGSATTILGRFTHTDCKVHDWVKDIADREQALYPEDTILAEIVHLPEARTGNILMRTAFRPYEIPYLAQSSVEQDYQIPLQDLKISIHNGQLVLRSERLNKRIIPRLGNAHNFSANALPVYHFLCDLQHQQRRYGIGFSWGVLSEQFSFLPRVRYQNVIIHRAKWQLKRSDYEHLLKASAQELSSTVQQWRTQWNLPRHIAVVEYDNELWIDLENSLSVKVLLNELKNRQEIHLVEFLYRPEQLPVTDLKGQHYANQFVAVFTKHVAHSNNVQIASIPSKTTMPARSLAPGSEWLYYKFYCGATTADDVLCDIIRPLARRLQKQGLIKGWFFIRYADPGLHLRVRFHLTKPAHIGAVAQAVQKATAQAFAQKAISRIQTDTYEREMERYGAALIVAAEQLFCEDSRTTTDFLHQIGRSDAQARWLYGLSAMEAILEIFNYTKEQKISLTKRMKTAFGNEFNMGSPQWKQLNKKYQTAEADIKDCFRANHKNRLANRVQKAVALKKEAIKPVAAYILSQHPDQQRLDDLLASYLHMMINRLFKSQQRVHELVLYDFATQYYQRQQIKVVKGIELSA